MLNTQVKRICLIVACLVMLVLGVLNLFEHNFIRGIIKIIISVIMLIIYSDKKIQI